MSIPQAVSLGLAGNQLSKTITGSSAPSAGRTAVAVGSGAALGASTAGAVVVGASAVGATAVVAVSAPVVVPLAIASGLVAGIASLFD